MATALPVGPDGTEAEGAPPGLPLVRAATLDGGGTPGPEDEHPAATTVSNSTEAIWTRLRTRRMLRAGRPASRSCPARGLCLVADLASPGRRGSRGWGPGHVLGGHEVRSSGCRVSGRAP